MRRLTLTLWGLICLTPATSLGGSVYVPPASAGVVEGDGAGVTDAAAFRLILGLGTAAVLDASAVQTADATLTALSGLTWSAGIQIPQLTAADTTSLLTVGTGANNLVQLTAAAKYPAADGSLITGVSASQVNGTCTWTKTWSASDGSITDVGGFTLTNLTDGGTAVDSAGNTYYILSSSSAIGRVTYGASLPTDTDAWEVELDFVPTVLDGSSGLLVDPGAGGKKEMLMFQSGVFATAGSVSWGNSARGAPATSRQVWTMRRHRDVLTEAYYNHNWLGSETKSSGAAGTTQRWCFLNCGSTLVSRTYKVYRISIRSGSMCETPPHLRDLGEVYP